MKVKFGVQKHLQDSDGGYYPIGWNDKKKKKIITRILWNKCYYNEFDKWQYHNILFSNRYQK